MSARACARSDVSEMPRGEHTSRHTRQQPSHTFYARPGATIEPLECRPAATLDTDERRDMLLEDDPRLLPLCLPATLPSASSNTALHNHQP